MCHDYYTAFGLQNRIECPASKSHYCRHRREKKVVYYSVSILFPPLTRMRMKLITPTIEKSMQYSFLRSYSSSCFVSKMWVYWISKSTTMQCYSCLLITRTSFKSNCWKIIFMVFFQSKCISYPNKPNVTKRIFPITADILLYNLWSV